MIRINKQIICNRIRRKYPQALGIRKRLQRLKVMRLYRYRLPEKIVAKCEKEPRKTQSIIQPYIAKCKKYLKTSYDEMEDILSNAPLYTNRADKERIRNDMLFCRLAYGFLPSEYICFELETKTPNERKEYVSDLDMNVFGYSVNDITSIQTILDKAESYKKFKNYFKRDALIIEKSKDYGAFKAFIKKHPIFVKKEIFSSMGKGVELVNISKFNQKSFFFEQIKKGKHLLEELVIQSPEMSQYNPSSVNTIRCFTMKIGNEIIVPWCFMRTGRNGSFVDNGGSGGLVIGVNPKTGIVNTDGFDEYNNRFKSHPDTKVTFVGSKIPDWEEMIALCKEMALNTEGMGYLSWDMAHTTDGWVVIEINEVGQFIGPQMTMKKGIKKELWSYFDQMINYVKRRRQ